MPTPNLSPWARRRLALGLATCLSLLDCSASESTEPGHPLDAGADGAADEGGETESDVPATLTGLFSHYDATIEANCPCYVEMGAYESVDECLMWQGSRSDWTACVTAVLDEYPTSEGLEVFKCLDRLLETTSNCLAKKACDATARAECQPSPLECVDSDVARSIGLQLSMKCPDITFLPRQQ